MNNLITKQDKGLICLFSVLTIIIILFMWFAWYSQIIEEKLTCYGDYNCKIETTRFFNIKSIKNFQITSQSKMTDEYIYKSREIRGRGLLTQSGHLYYVMIDGKRIFKFPVCSVRKYNRTYEEVCKPFIDSIIEDFDKYKENELYNNYKLISSAKEANSFLSCVITGFLLWSILIYVFCNESDFFKKLKKKIQKMNKKKIK